MDFTFTSEFYRYRYVINFDIFLTIKRINIGAKTTVSYDLTDNTVIYRNTINRYIHFCFE